MPPTIRRACKTWKEALHALRWPDGTSRWDTTRVHACFHCGKRRSDLKRSICTSCRTDDFVPEGAPASNPMAGGYRLCTDHCTTVMKPKHLFAPGNKKCISCLEKRRARKMRKRNQVAVLDAAGTGKRRRKGAHVDDDDEDDDGSFGDVPSRVMRPRKSAQSARRRIAAIGTDAAVTGGAGDDGSASDEYSYATDSTVSADEGSPSEVVLPITPPGAVAIPEALRFPDVQPSAQSAEAAEAATFAMFGMSYWPPAMSKPVPPPRLSAPASCGAALPSTGMTPVLTMTPFGVDFDLAGLWDDLGSPSTLRSVMG